jgi:hypothetical protein
MPGAPLIQTEKIGAITVIKLNKGNADKAPKSGANFGTNR